MRQIVESFLIDVGSWHALVHDDEDSTVRCFAEEVITIDVPDGADDLAIERNITIFG